MRYGLPFLSAALFWLAFPPVDLGFLGWVALVPLIAFAVTESKGWRAFVLPWLAGAIFFGAAGWWLRFTTGLGGPIFISLYVGLYWAIFATVIRWACRPGRARVPLAVAAPVAWVALELVRSRLFTGMPIFHAGYTQHGSLALIQVADLGGVWLVSYFVVFVNAALAVALVSAPASRERRISAATAAAAVAFMALYGLIRLPMIVLEDGMKIGIVQANIPQDVKEIAKASDPARQREMWERHMELTAQVVKESPDLIVWPEVATTELLVWLKGVGWHREDDAYLRSRQVAEKTGIRAIIGTMIVEPPMEADLPYEEYVNRHEFTNSAVYFDEKGEIVGRFDKIKLMPFAERMLFGDLLPVNRWVASFLKLKRVFEFRPGSAMPVFDHPKGRFATLICSENYYPEISREFAGKGAALLVNISNDGWFRDSAELDQMLAMAKFRAVENRVHYVRATNTGISAMIEPTGRVAYVIEDSAGKRKCVGGTLARTARVTKAASPYRVLGDWAAWLCAGLAAGGWIALKFQRRFKSVDTPNGGA